VTNAWIVITSSNLVEILPRKVPRVVNLHT